MPGNDQFRLTVMTKPTGQQHTLRSNHSEKAKDRVFGVSLGDDSERTRKHGLIQRLSAFAGTVQRGINESDIPRR